MQKKYNYIFFLIIYMENRNFDELSMIPMKLKLNRNKARTIIRLQFQWHCLQKQSIFMFMNYVSRFCGFVWNCRRCSCNFIVYFHDFQHPSRYQILVLHLITSWWHLISHVFSKFKQHMQQSCKINHITSFWTVECFWYSKWRQTS